MLDMCPRATDHVVDEMRRHPHATVRHGRIRGRELDRRDRDALADRNRADRRAVPLAARQHDARALAGEVDARPAAEAEAGDHRDSRVGPTSRASVTAPTFDDCARISPTVIVSVPRGSASWMTLSATWIEYGSVYDVVAVTRCSES